MPTDGFSWCNIWSSTPFQQCGQLLLTLWILTVTFPHWLSTENDLMSLFLLKLSRPSDVTQAAAAESSMERVRKRRDTSDTVGSDPDFWPLRCHCLTLTCLTANSRSCSHRPRLCCLLKLLPFVSSPQGGDSLSRLLLRPSPTNPFTPTPFKVCGSPCCVATPLSYMCACPDECVRRTPCCLCGVLERAVHAHNRTCTNILWYVHSLCVEWLSRKMWF